MRRLRGLTAALALCIAIAGAGITLIVMPAASAITRSVAFTADDLSTWQTNGIVYAMAEAEGIVFAGGTFSKVRPPAGSSGSEQDAANFVALDAAAGTPTSCKLSFTVGSGSATVRALAASRDAKTLYIGGYFGAVNGVRVSSLAAVDIATCTPKESFHPAFPATVRALAVTGDSVYAAGDFTSVENQKRERFAAVDATTGALKPFAAHADEPGRAVEVTPDGMNVIIGGDFFTVNGSNSHALAVVNANTGSLTKAYPNGYFPSNSVVKDIAVDDQGGFYVGNEGTGGGVFDGRTGLRLADFSEKWRDRCLGATQSVLPYQGVLYSSSHAHDCSSENQFPDGKRHFLLAQHSNHQGWPPSPVDGYVPSPPKVGWHPTANDGIGEGIGPRVMSVAEKGGVEYLWVGGEFTAINGTPQQSLTRFASVGDTGAPTAPIASVSSVEPAEAKIRWRTSYDQDDSRLTYRIYRNGSKTPIAAVAADSLEWERRQASWTDTTVKVGNAYTYRVTATDAAGNTSAPSATASVVVPATAQAYPSRVRADGADLYWRYDDSITPYVADSSIAGETSGIHVNSPGLQWTPGAVAGESAGISFNGVDQQVYSDHRQTVGSSYTVETWFSTTTTRGGKLIGFGNNKEWESTHYDKQIYMTNTGRLIFGTFNGSTNTVATSFFRGYNDGRWHHVVATQGPAGMSLYLDGRLEDTSRVSTHEPTNGYWHVGGDNLTNWPSSPTSNFFAGQIDETATYPTVLTQTQIIDHYNLAKVAPDTVAVVRPVDDTYINQASPSAANGSATQLAVRGSGSLYETYLRFSLPAPPPGHVLKKASLQVKTTGQSGSDTLDPLQVVPVTSDWSGTATTYYRKPTLASKILGSLPSGLPESSALYNIDLDTTALIPALGGSTYSIALTSNGNDPLWLWSSESTTSENTPQLFLTFGKP
ncbi:DUF7594 domain-containing protein [Streptomyces virginiae]|uniref:CBM96 family carbohydrate-binding protein n=1 Tax=Streptomyces virginiae TaxID=1961 RepID=UPI00099B458F|nr:DNRLRE domain-containing protein [Streptomyces virginiae]